MYRQLNWHAPQRAEARDILASNWAVVLLKAAVGSGERCRAAQALLIGVCGVLGAVQETVARLLRLVKCNLPQTVRHEAAGEARTASRNTSNDYLHDFLELWLDGVVDTVVAYIDKSAAMEFSKKSRKKKLQKQLVTKRRTYDSHERMSILKKCELNKKMSTVVGEVRSMEGFSHFSKSTLKRIRKHTVCKKRGRKVNSDFEHAVLGSLVFSVLKKVQDRQRAEVIANAAHSYSVIQRAALSFQKNDERFKDDPSVSKLQFPNRWITGFLQRNAFCKRKATTITKQRPPLEEIRAIMADIQKKIEEKELTSAQCFSADETGMFYASPPKNQYVPADARAAARRKATERRALQHLSRATATAECFHRCT